MKILLCLVCHFCLAAFEILFFFLTSDNLIIYICLCHDLLGLRMGTFELHESECLYLPRFNKFSALFLK